MRVSMVSIMVLIPVAIVALILLAVAGARAEPDKGGEEMIKNVYVYLVLFATLMMTIGGSVAIFMAAADIVSPNVYYQSFEEYKRYGGMEKPLPEGQGQVKLSEEEILANYNAMVAAEKERSIQRAQNSLIKSLGWVVIPLPVFIYFQRRLPKKS
jgi:hypothetical protein